MRKAVAPPTIHLSQKKIHMSKQNWWWPRTWMSQSVNATFVQYSCRWTVPQISRNCNNSLKIS